MQISCDRYPRFVHYYSINNVDFFLKMMRFMYNCILNIDCPLNCVSCTNQYRCDACIEGMYTDGYTCKSKQLSMVHQLSRYPSFFLFVFLLHITVIIVIVNVIVRLIKALKDICLHCHQLR